MNDFNNGWVNQGWQCPICKKVYSPSTPFCYFCGRDETYTTTNTSSIDKKLQDNKEKEE